MTMTAHLYLYSESIGEESISEAVERNPIANGDIVQNKSEKTACNINLEKLPSGGGVADAVRRGGNNKPANNAKTYSEKRIGRNTRNYMKLPYNPQLKERAKELRKAGNLSEIVFWNQIKNKQFKGLDFDRQKIVGNYIVDFFCTNCNVVIEIDGSSHDDKVEYDAARDAYLEGLGLSVIHISDTEVLHNMSGVMEWLHVHPAFDHPVLSDTPPEEGSFREKV